MGIRKNIGIVGGGLAGLVSTYLLAKNGHSVQLFEKKNYPFHRVCGEYLSNEVVDFLKRESLFPESLDIPQIDTFEFSDTNGQNVFADLDLGGIGISRFALDDFLFQKAKAAGATIHTGIQVQEVIFIEGGNSFELTLADGKTFSFDYVIGAFGKRSRIDSEMGRAFTQKRSPFIGVKYHIRIDRPKNVVALHNFKRGYCGINAVEGNRFNLCYLGRREDLRKYGSIPDMEQEILWKNPHLNRIFQEAEFLFDKPEVINEISFEKKSPVEQHILMTGDAAGLITPLNGNGMAMAIHAAYLVAETLDQFDKREEIELNYRKVWKAHFENRLTLGRWLQRLFGSNMTSSFARKLLADYPYFSRKIIQNTHGEPF